MPANFTQCPFCGTSIVETEGFNAQAWMRAHAKTCLGVETPEAPKRKKVKAPKSPVTDVVGRVGEVLAKEFVKQLFKKGS